MLHVVGIVELGAPLVNGHILRGINQISGVVGVRCESVCYESVSVVARRKLCSLLVVPLV
jgi:hypothetical protein